MTRRADPEAGFTLIELLIDLTLLGMLAALIATGTRFSGRAWSSAERQTDEIHDIDAVQGLLRRTIWQVRPSFGAIDPSDLTVAFRGEPDRLSLVVVKPATQGNGPWVRATFYVARSGESRALFMSWLPDAPAIGEGQSGSARQVMLLDHVTALRLGYFGFPAEGGAPVWQDRWENRDRLPELLRITIARDGSSFQPWPELVVATQITANASCVFDVLTSACKRPR